MKKEFDVLTGYKLRVSNRCVFRGCHDPESDWSIIVIAKDLEELAERYADKFYETKIDPDFSDLSEVEYIEYEGETIILKCIKEYDWKETGEIAKTVLYNDKIKALREKIALERKEEEARNYRIHQKEKEEKELATYNSLKKKYESS